MAQNGLEVHLFEYRKGKKNNWKSSITKNVLAYKLFFGTWSKRRNIILILIVRIEFSPVVEMGVIYGTLFPTGDYL